MGAPGSGKELRQKNSWMNIVISTGVLLRQAIESGSELGKR